MFYLLLPEDVDDDGMDLVVIKLACRTVSMVTLCKLNGCSSREMCSLMEAVTAID